MSADTQPSESKPDINLNKVSGLTTSLISMRGPQRDLDRETRISQLYRSGKTLEAVGNEFRLTRERIRQILKRAGSVRLFQFVGPG